MKLEIHVILDIWIMKSAWSMLCQYICNAWQILGLFLANIWLILGLMCLVYAWHGIKYSWSWNEFTFLLLTNSYHWVSPNLKSVMLRGLVLMFLKSQSLESLTKTKFGSLGGLLALWKPFQSRGAFCAHPLCKNESHTARLE